jgi:hypothetical protein
MIEFLKQNSTWLKDIFTIFFTATGSLIAILSYRRAKSTIFQPKRTEVTKKQTEILSEFLSLYTNDGNTIDKAVDYINLFRYNIDITLRDYNLSDLEKITEKYVEYEQNIGGWIQFLEADIYDFVNIEGSIKDYDLLIFEKNNRERQKYYEVNAKLGEVTIHRIFYTKKYFEFIKKLKDLSNNPFLPKDIQDVANQIGQNITINLNYNLRDILKRLIIELYNAHEDKNSDNYEILSDKFRYETLWGIFETERKQHNEDYELLKKKIRKHLMIDEKW